MNNVARKVMLLSAIGTAIALGGCATSSPPPPPPPQAMDQSTSITSQETYTPPPAPADQTAHRGPRG